MVTCLNAVGFVFDKVNTYIKKDNKCKYSKYYCQECAWINKKNENKIENISPIPGILKSCNKCTSNSQYKICIFKLKKEYFINSSLDISTNKEDAWNVFKNNVIYLRNGNFVISVTNKCNKSHSFYANLIKAKKCTCCEAVILYFKYNIISLLTHYEEFQINNIPPDNNITEYLYYPYSVACANLNSNITFDLKSCEYKNVRFFISPYYKFNNSLELCNICV